jgi:hypothetical protein
MANAPFDEQLRQFEDRMINVERKYSDALDLTTRLFQQSHNSLTKWLTVFSIFFSVVLAFSLTAIGIQSFSTWQRFRETLEREQTISLRRIQILPRVARIDSGRRKLMSGPEDQKDRAIWDDLLDTLKNTPPAEFYDIVLEFRNVIPELTIPTEPEAFRDRYRGAIWIYIILLESGVDKVIAEIRQTAPPAETLRSWATRVESKVDPANQQEFNDSVERLARGLGGRRQ